MKSILGMLLWGFLAFMVMGLLVFGLAGTIDYWQAWVYFAVTLVSSWISSIYLLRRSGSAVLERRVWTAESRSVQKVLQGTIYFFWFAMVAISALDHRFGWSVVPTAICWLGFILFALGMGAITVVLAQNNHAAVNVRVEDNQSLASTGLYGLVRHPMYTSSTFLMVGTPLALGSYWGLLPVIPNLIAYALRIRDEEKLLQEELDGYHKYMQKVPHRLVPGIW